MVHVVEAWNSQTTCKEFGPFISPGSIGRGWKRRNKICNKIRKPATSPARTKWRMTGMSTFPKRVWKDSSPSRHSRKLSPSSLSSYGPLPRYPATQIRQNCSFYFLHEMCRCLRSKGSRTENSTVPVFDLTSNHLIRFPLGAVTGTSPRPKSLSLTKSTDRSSVDKERFEKVVIPRFGLFDLYASNENNETYPRLHTVIARANQDTKGRSFVARLNYGRLGPGANMRRAIFRKERILYIGSVTSWRYTLLGWY